MPKHIVCLTFDFDALSGFIARGQVGPSWLSRGEFGPRVAAPRLLALFARLRDEGAVFERVDETVEEFRRRSPAAEGVTDRA